MPRAREHLVNVDDTPYYHVTSRCVRRAFLCGQDNETGKSYDHRKTWLEQRIHLLSSLFAIDLCAYAVMSNHYHIVLKLMPKPSVSWSAEEVLNRWCVLFKGTLLVQKHQRGEPLTLHEAETLNKAVSVYRDRLTSLSWFMKCLNEPIARKANAEDGCTGHFWESRFTSQALLSDKALLAAMAYVDLNPVRAHMADTPEDSPHTSIKERLKPVFDLQQAVLEHLITDGEEHHAIKENQLIPFRDQVQYTDTETTSVLPFTFKNYLELVDATGRLVRPNKTGAISIAKPPILQRLSLSLSQWERYATQFEQLHRFGEFRLASG